MALAFACEPSEQNGVFGGIVSIITTVVSPQPVDFDLDRKGFDAIDSSRQNTSQHGWMLGERLRKGNALPLPLTRPF
jgi:hypothetical protein